MNYMYTKAILKLINNFCKVLRVGKLLHALQESRFGAIYTWVLCVDVNVGDSTNAFNFDIYVYGKTLTRAN